MRRNLLVLAAVLAVVGCASTCSAQAIPTNSAGFSDPFFLYYGFFLPRQQYLANQPGPEAFINQQQAQRVDNALAERAGLYGPLPSLGEEDLDPSRPFGARRPLAPMARPSGMFSSTNQNLRGTGPPRYFNRHGSYYPTLTRSGRESNKGVNLRFGRSNLGGAAAAGFY